MIKNFNEAYKTFVEQLNNIEKNKPCTEDIVILGLDKGIKIDMNIFMPLFYNVIKLYSQDYIESKYGYKIYKNKLKKITYYFNFDYCSVDKPLCFLEFEYKDINYVNEYDKNMYSVKIPNKNLFVINSDIIL